MAQAARAALEAAAALGAAGQSLFVLLYAAACVLCIPAAPLSLAAGAAFGVGRGFLLVWAGATLGACAAFLSGRYLLRGWAARRLEASPAWRALSRAVEREGWRVVLLARLSPALPFALLNYGLGLTRLGLAEYAWSSCAGMAPGALLFAWLGAAAGAAARAGAGAPARTPAEWAFFVLGLLATLVVAARLARAAGRALAEETV